jgi:hypothetical protein
VAEGGRRELGKITGAVSFPQEKFILNLPCGLKINGATE